VTAQGLSFNTDDSTKIMSEAMRMPDHSPRADPSLARGRQVSGELLPHPDQGRAALRHEAPSAGHRFPGATSYATASGLPLGRR
jgi:hypothetical protein